MPDHQTKKSLAEQEEDLRRERLAFEKRKLDADRSRELGKGLGDLGKGMMGCGCMIPFIAIAVFALLVMLGVLR